MNILFLTPQLPHPPKQGTAIRNWGLIKSLSAKHKITLLSFADTNSISPELQATCAQIKTVAAPHRATAQRLRDLVFSPLPDLAHRLNSTEFKTHLEFLILNQRFDVVFCEGLELAKFALHLQPATIGKIIFDAHNAETVLQRRAFANDIRNLKRLPTALYSLAQTSKLQKFEARVCRTVHHVTCVSDEDAKALRQLVPTLAPTIVPNGIFLSDYEPTTNHQPSATNQMLFTGKMDYRPNVDAVVWFANEIFPIVQREVPNAEFVIVGQKPTPAVEALRANNGIKVVGAVDDIRPHVRNSTVYIAPLRMGGGTRFKLLEAMAMRKPIISTTIGAEGFAVQHGREMLLADEADDFAQAVITLLLTDIERTKLAGAGYEFVKKYDWGEIVPTIEKILASV